jgi:RimJ/RimL family protein N-acetyltransferase
MFATERWPEVALGTTRWARRVLMPALIASGAHRAECRSLASNEASHRWLLRLGARAEARHAGYGKNREDFITFAWRRDDVHFQPAEAAETARPAAALVR